MPNSMRWLAVLPGAFVCALLSAFPLHWVLYGTLTGSGIAEPYPETPERLLGPLVAALAFVWGGSRIAPLRRVETAVVLFGAELLLIGAVFALGFTGAHIGRVQYYLQLGGLPPAGAVVGAFIGLYLVRRENSANVKAPEEVPELPAGEQASENGTSTKRDWLQITLNVALAGGCIFMAYKAISYPREALTIVLAVAGTSAVIGLLGLAGMLIGWTFNMVAALICRLDDKRRGLPSDFSLADRVRLRLLAKPWLANWLPRLWDGLREDLRRSRSCEISDCWNEPTSTWEGHSVCSKHYAEIAKVAADRARL